MYAFDANAAIFRRAWRLLPALAAILIPASVLSKKSAMLSRSASERISLCFFALASTRISVWRSRVWEATGIAERYAALVMGAPRNTRATVSARRKGNASKNVLAG
jgi:hypothetical protein